MALQIAHGLLTGSIKPTDTKVQVGKLGEHKVGKDGNIVLGPAHPSLVRNSQSESAMKRVGFLLKVKPEKIQEYKARHKVVWPEMLTALRRAGWRNYSLYLREDGLLFGYFETPESFQAALDGMAKEEVNARWQEHMAPFFENLTGAHADQSMVELEEVFHLD